MDFIAAATAFAMAFIALVLELLNWRRRPASKETVFVRARTSTVSHAISDGTAASRSIPSQCWTRPKASGRLLDPELVHAMKRLRMLALECVPRSQVCH